jgi:hypothetical protein
MVDFTRYLSSKRSVDDRALNRRVWHRLRSEVACASASASGSNGGATLRVADIGAGIATGAERMREWELAPPSTRLHYTAVEPREELHGELGRRLDSLSRAALGAFDADVSGETLDGFALARGNRERFDLVVAHALVDILDLPSSLDALVRLARPGGLVYLPITFDGETTFEPGREEDDAILSVYHHTMNGPGSARTGRRLFHALRRHPVDVLEMGSSDWIVHPVGDGYPEDEAFFLRFILTTIEGAVAELVDPGIVGRWLSARSSQVERAELVYGAHQLDVLGRKRMSSSCT